MSLLLINNNIENYSVFVSSAKEETKTLVFDPKNDTYNTILGNISALENKEDIENVALVSHGELFDLFQLLEKEKKSWEEFTVFLQNIKKSLPEMKNFDFLGCALVSEPDWKQSLNKLESEVDFNIRASDDNTGNLKSGGDWILETDNVNIKDLYFTEAIKDYEGLLLTTVGYAHWHGREPVTMTGGRLLAAWGNSRYGASAPNGLVDLKAVYSTAGAFAALKNDGSVVAWGTSFFGGSAPNGLNGVKAIYSNFYSFAALKNDGSVVAWGNSSRGGSSPNGLNGVKVVYSTKSSFAALKNDGSIVSWGLIGSAPNGLNGVTSVYSTASAFAALKNDGSVVVWGEIGSAPNGLNGVIAIYSNDYAFAALKNDGSVVTWGHSDFGGNSSPVSSSLTSGVTAIYSTVGAFAALKNDGTVVVWGSKYHGGSLNFIYNTWGTWVENNDQRLGPALSDPTKPVTAIYSTTKAFSALRNDGSVVTWGNMDYGATYTTDSNRITNIKEIYSNEFAFAGLKYNGTVVTWGNHSYGGNLDDSVLSDQSNPVTAIYSTATAFAALKNDRSVVSWGSSSLGGSSPSGLTQVRGMYSTKQAFVAFRDIYPVQYLKTGSAGFDDDSENSDYEETETYGTFVSDTYAGPETIDSHAYVQDAILSGAILIDGDLQNMNFTNSDLTGADLTNANLRNSIFTNSDLTGAKLTGANLENVDLSGTNLTDADLSGVLIQSTDLTNTILNFREPVILHQDSDSIYGLPSGYACINDGDKKLIWTSPRDIILSSETFNENISSGSEIATISSVDSDSTVFTYSLVSGTDDTDNDKFQIVGDKLKINAVPDYETQSSYNIRIKTQDESNNSYEKSFTLNVINIFEAATEITLSNYLINETLPAGTVIADISSNSEGTNITYSLVQSHYHALYEISGNKLKIKQQLDYRIHFQPSIEIRVVNEAGRSYEEYIDLYMRYMGVVGRTIAENIPAGSVVGTLVTFDPSTTSYTYSLVSGEGDTDNDHFEISGNEIKIKNSPDYESKTSYNIRIRSTSNQTGNILEKEWTFDVTDEIAEAPTNINLSTDIYLKSKPGVNQTYSDTEFLLNENAIAGDVIATISTIDQDSSVFTYQVTGNFEVSGDKLKIKQDAISLSLSTPASTTITSTDGSGKKKQKTFTFNTRALLVQGGNSFPENISAGSEIGTLVTKEGYNSTSEITYNYSFVSGSGDTDNGKFLIEGDKLKIKNIPDYETQSSYSVRIKSVSNHTAYELEKTFLYYVTNQFETPTDITLSTDIYLKSKPPQPVMITSYTELRNAVLQNSTIRFNHSWKGGLVEDITTGYDSSKPYPRPLTILPNIIVSTGATENEHPVSPQTIHIDNTGDRQGFKLGTKTSQYGEVYQVWAIIKPNGGWVIWGLRISPYDGSSYIVMNRLGDVTIMAIAGVNHSYSPRDFSLDENIPAGSEVATMSTNDPDNTDNHTYSLVSGTGDNDNNHFDIVGDKLKIKNSPDYETKSSYSIRLKTEDEDFKTYEKSFTLYVDNIPEPPTDINLSSMSFNENISAGSEIATINTVDPDSTGSFTYSLVSEATTSALAVTFQNVGGGNKYFIDGQQQSVLELIEGNTYNFNWSSSSNHPFRLSTTSDGTHNGGVEYTTGVTVDTVNHITTIIVSNSAPTLYYYCQHHAGMGGIANITTDDNNHFEIVGDKLKIKNSPDYETKSTYNIRIKSEDESNNTYTEKFTLTVNDITEAPTDITLSSMSFEENIPVGSDIATISTTSPDNGGSFTYSLVSGTGDSDNSYFEIVNDKLLIKISPDYGTKNNYTIRLKTQTVNLLTYEKSFNLTVNNIHEYTKLTKWYSSEQVQQSTSSGHVGGAFAMSEDGNRLVLGSRSGEDAFVEVYKRQGNAWVKMGSRINNATFYGQNYANTKGFNVAMSANGEKIVVADNGRDGIPFSKNFNGVDISGKIGTFRVYNFNSNYDNWNSMGGGHFLVPQDQAAKSVLGFSGDGSTVVLGGYSVPVPAAGWISTFRYQHGSYIEKHQYGQYGNILSKAVK